MPVVYTSVIIAHGSRTFNVMAKSSHASCLHISHYSTVLMASLVTGVKYRWDVNDVKLCTRNDARCALSCYL